MNKEAIIDSLINLSKHSAVIIDFYRNNSCDNNAESKCVRREEKIRLSLCEADIHNWGEPIAMAHKHIEDIKLELTHESKHPNNFLSIMASVELSKFVR